MSALLISSVFPQLRAQTQKAQPWLQVASARIGEAEQQGLLLREEQNQHLGY
jgi:hypothetical protein